MATMQSSSPIARPGLSRHLRLIGALASKDIVDALRTKSTLMTIIISLLMVLFYRFIPALASGGETLNVMLYAEGESAVVTALEQSPALAVYPVDSRDRLMEVFAGAEDVELAVVIPHAAAAQQQAGQPITIEGHLMYWVGPEKRAEIKALVEDDLSTALGQPVTLNLEGNDVYFDADHFFFVFSATFALLFITTMIGIALIPNLMVEEKEAKTMDALLVSPASAGHLVAGKALAGLFHGLVACVVALVVFRYLIIRWDLAILATVLGLFFMIPIGLLLGIYAKVRAQLQLLAWFMIIPLLIPAILVALEGLVPTGAIAVMNWIPTVLVAKVFRLSLTPNATLAHFGPAVAVLIAASLILYALVVWAVRRQDRR